MPSATIKAIEYVLPDNVLTNEQLVQAFPEWTVEKIVSKTGIQNRHMAAQGEFASDLAVRAAKKLFDSGGCTPDEIDFILLCTQSPDYFLPTTACLVQHELGIPMTAGALDFNLGCSGFVYGLGMAKGLIETGQARNVLLITSETYSKYLANEDKSSRAIFGDAAAATLITARDNSTSDIGTTVWGTDGSGAANLMVRNGAMRHPSGAEGTQRPSLYMNGAEIFTFTLRVVPDAIETLLQKSGYSLADFDLFVFHQANNYMLEHLRKRLKIPEDKFYVYLESCGNTVSSTIPIALKEAQREKKLKKNDLVMLVGFGVGYSWAAATIRW
jgi:3-oxoacyl-[acyl-carrier-protein] synthase-3